MNSYYAIGAAVAREKLGMVLPSALIGTGLGAAGGALAAGENNRLTGALAGGALGGGLGAAGGMGLKTLMEGAGGLPSAAASAVKAAPEAAASAVKAAPEVAASAAQAMPPAPPPPSAGALEMLGRAAKPPAPPPPSAGALEMMGGAAKPPAPTVSPDLKAKLDALRPGAERPDMFDQAMRAANPGPAPSPPDFLYNVPEIPAAAA